MTTAQARRRLLLILDYEPSWFAESGSALAIFGWAVFALCSTRFHIAGWAYAGPACGLLLGPAQMAVLFRLQPVPRVLMAVLGFVWWTTICCTMLRALGIVPAEGVYLSLAYMNLLTIVKFSVWASRLPPQHPTRAI